jgi:3-methyladenine DNA glycosylase AlkD
MSSASSTLTIVEFVHSELASKANAKVGREMAAYMKTTQPFYGVQKPAREPIFKEMLERYAPADGSAYRAGVLSLWDAGAHGGMADEGGPAWPPLTEYPGGKAPAPRKDSKMSPPELVGPRELLYASCCYAEAFDEHLTPAHLPLFKRMIVEGAWWDIVDWVGGSMVGHILLTNRNSAAPVMRKWVDDENLWVRRSAIIAQLKHKEQTDESMLFDFCLKRADEPDFFIRKAIGWALRQHARTNPDAVKAFLKSHKPKLAALTVREAGKHIGVKP